MAEGMGFEPMTPISRGKRLAGARTRPLCDPSRPPQLVYISLQLNYNTDIISFQRVKNKCRGRDSNPHPHEGERILSPPRLPFRHLGKFGGGERI